MCITENKTIYVINSIDFLLILKSPVLNISFSKPVSRSYSLIASKSLNSLTNPSNLSLTKFVKINRSMNPHIIPSSLKITSLFKLSFQMLQ